MTELKAFDRLVSYWELLDKPCWVLPEYVTQGKIGTVKAKRE